MVESVRIAVLTDLHAYEPDPKDAKRPEPSWLRTDGNRTGGPLADPFSSLEKLITDENLSAEYLFCCGDMTDKAGPSALLYVWTNLQTITKKLGASLVATAGNHDVDSRNQFDPVSPLDQLKNLEPTFPVDDAALANMYWARDYVIHDGDRVRILNLNTAAAHGYGGEQAAKYFERGLVKDRTIEQIAHDLKTAGARPLNVLLCHHHPVRANPLYTADYSEMQNGDKLLSELERARVGDWIVIHGHKHVSRLAYATGGASSPVILSAGSFSVRLAATLTGARNEFYVVELFPSTPEQPLRGFVHTWTWNLGSGWQPAQYEGGLARRVGFGARRHPRLLANEIRAVLTERPATPTKWDALVGRIPDLDFVLPSDLKELVAILEHDEVGVERNSFGLPSQFQIRQ